MDIELDLSLFDAILDSAVLLDKSGRIVDWNPGAAVLFGYHKKEVLGRSVNLIYQQNHPFQKIIQETLPQQKKWGLETNFVRKNGTHGICKSSLNLITGAPSGKSVALLVHTELNQQIKARIRGQRLARVFRLSTMEEMASGMAHEISQPLAAVVNYTQGCVRYLQKETHDPSQIIEIMNKAVTQAERAGEIIHRLKNFFCKGQLFKTPCKIPKLIRETAGLIRDDLSDSKTKMEFNLDKALPLISIDRIQLQQVLLNLMQNSIEAMKPIDSKKRKLIIQAKPADKHNIEIIVSDTGPGFSKEMIHKVFEPFFTTKAHGRGMGLAICRSIIEAHGGQFIINPNTMNQSWIKFSLPIV